ncbi:Rho gtpase-activating protein [Thalictrum thalictroides]|uniref:Rho gtpase-activating protein n=1 Tax=Thalictrum thalictroides TaxID=46969 RepID=A0A7J6V6L1_THATH|nr:Rho gtpase-activating protein [Thalictrum thalictroides]
MTGVLMLTKGGGCGGGGGGKGTKGGETTTTAEQNQLSLLALLVAAIRKSMVACRVEERDEVISAVHQMEIGWPTNVQHITHVTFDRYNGFLGLPVEFEVDVPCRVPSASISVFGVSAESMQCSYDTRGNSVPTILLLMQERLYTQGGLKAEGIFRINPENSQEEHVRDQLNRGIVPSDIDVHCLAGLIKAWFRELPEGILDGLSPEQVLQCNTEDECVELVKELLPIQGALLDWAVDLMADVVEEEEFNKMNARNIAMVFAPNMTQMSDPLTALMHAVQVMNLLKTLIIKTLREREETTTGGYSPYSATSYEQQTDEDYDSQQELNLSCELRGPNSDYDNHANCNSDNEDEVDPLNEIEECFLRQLNGDEELTSNVDTPQESASDPRIENVSSPSSFSGYNADSGLSFSDAKNESSCLSTSNADESVTSMVAKGDIANTDSPLDKFVDLEMVEKRVVSASDHSSPSLI